MTRIAQPILCTQTVKRCRIVRFSDKFKIYHLASTPDTQNDPRESVVTNHNLNTDEVQEHRYPTHSHTKPKYLEQFVDGSEIEENDLVSFIVDYCYRISDAPKTYQEAIPSDDSQKGK